VVLVGIKCPLDVLEQRERERGDRIIGIARYQFDRVHTNKQYDLVINSAEMSAVMCAEAIHSYLQSEMTSPLTTLQKFLGPIN
jgi:chloramphenicol 3-O phosphotransferase